MLFLPLKIGVFFVTFECTSQGYVEREFLSRCSRKWRTLIQGSLCSPLKSGGFFGTFECTSKGYVEGELLSLRSRERGVLIQGSLCSPLKSGGFFGTFGCTWWGVESSKGLVGPRSLRSRGPIIQQYNVACHLCAWCRVCDVTPFDSLDTNHLAALGRSENDNF